MEFVQQLGAYSYLGVFVIGLLANLVIPVPEEVTLLTLGYLAATGAFNVVLIIPCIMLGLYLSDCLVYFVTLKGSKFIRKIYDKIFKGDTSMLESMSDKKLERVIIFSRFIAYLRFLAPFLSAYHKMGMKKFTVLEGISLSVYTTLYVLLGYFLRNQLERLLLGVNTVQHVMVVFAIVFVLSIVFFIIKHHTKKYMSVHHK